jgi:alkanesulfonate monooxygenase SsuD/methylene tetrahydromethanopterin reductase-like flavin-dependent oxidoreductase (luciferase family)/hemerythrin-like domain-containing protein
MPDYGHELAFGTFITPQAARPADVVALARLTEQAGLDLATFQDHPYQPGFLDSWTLLSWVAAETELLRLATNVLNLPLRLPAIVARSAASLDLLSGGRFELGIGAGAFWDAIAAMGGRRLTGAQSVKALEEAIDVIRLLWSTEEPGPARYDGRYYRLDGARRGPAPFHDVGIWIGAYRPRMLDLVGRKGDGWLPSQSYLQPGDLAAGNRAIDAAASRAGRDPSEIRRLLNIAPEPGSPARWAQELARLALEEGISAFLLMGDDPAMIRTFAGEVAPAVRELVTTGRLGEPLSRAQPQQQPEGLGVTPTPDEGTRVSGRVAWDEAARPRRAPADGLEYTRRGRLVAQHLIDVHDMLRTELSELREVLSRVRDGAVSAADARSELHQMSLRQNDWTLGAFCARYCAVVAQHHGLEDDSIFPHLARSEPELEPVIDRLVEEHVVIGDAIHRVDHALVEHINHPEDFEPVQEAIDFLTDALLSHLSYEEHELVEPLARLGFYSGQV